MCRTVEREFVEQALPNCEVESIFCTETLRQWRRRWTEKQNMQSRGIGRSRNRIIRYQLCSRQPKDLNFRRAGAGRTAVRHLTGRTSIKKGRAIQARPSTISLSRTVTPSGMRDKIKSGPRDRQPMRLPRSSTRRSAASRFPFWFPSPLFPPSDVLPGPRSKDRYGLMRPWLPHR